MAWVSCFSSFTSLAALQGPTQHPLGQRSAQRVPQEFPAQQWPGTCTLRWARPEWRQCSLLMRYPRDLLVYLYLNHCKHTPAPSLWRGHMDRLMSRCSGWYFPLSPNLTLPPSPIRKEKTPNPWTLHDGVGKGHATPKYDIIVFEKTAEARKPVWPSPTAGLKILIQEVPSTPQEKEHPYPQDTQHREEPEHALLSSPGHYH